MNNKKIQDKLISFRIESGFTREIHFDQVHGEQRPFRGKKAIGNILFAFENYTTNKRRL